MLISLKDSILVLVLLSSVVLLLIIACVLLALKFRQYRSRPYLLACCFLTLQLLGISGVILKSILYGRPDAHFDAILRPESLIAGFLTIIFLLSYVIEIKLPGKLDIKKALYGLSPFIIAAASLVLVHPDPVSSLDEIFNGLKRPEVLLRLIIVFFFVAYPIVAACMPYEWRQCLVSRKTITILDILICIVSPMFIMGMVCGYFPAIVANYIIAIAIDSIVVYIELKVRIPTTKPVKNVEFHKGSDEPSFLNSPEIWMNPDMSAIELAKIMGTNHTYLLNMIKQMGYSSYSDMINRKRVEYICDMLQKEPDVNIISIMFEAGFRSRSTASREFKRIVECTPSEYQESIQKN